MIIGLGCVCVCVVCVVVRVGRSVVGLSTRLVSWAFGVLRRLVLCGVSKGVAGVACKTGASGELTA